MSGVSNPRAQAQFVERYLRGGGDYRYTLDQPDTEGKDPLQVFLFEAKAGHCEYFSTAMAIMMRSLGLPARNVTGFLGADYNPYGDYYAVRNGNAHSWVEVFIDGRWVTFDPTPASGQVFAAPSGLAVKMRQVIDAMRVRWAEYVVEYNIRDQAKALQGLAAWYRSLRGDRGAKPFGADGQTRGKSEFGADSVPARLALVRGHHERLWRWCPAGFGGAENAVAKPVRGGSSTRTETARFDSTFRSRAAFEAPAKRARRTSRRSNTPKSSTARGLPRPMKFARSPMRTSLRASARRRCPCTTTSDCAS